MVANNFLLYDEIIISVNRKIAFNKIIWYY